MPRTASSWWYRGKIRDFLPVVLPLSSSILDPLDEVLDEIEDAVPRPGVLPEVRRRVAAPRRGDRRVARAAIVALVERQEAWSSAPQFGRHEDQIRVDREVRETPAEREERLLGAPVETVLA